MSTTKTIICDRCGHKEPQHMADGHHGWVRLTAITARGNCDLNDHGPYDLCRRCEAELDHWMKGRPAELVKVR